MDPTEEEESVALTEKQEVEEAKGAREVQTMEYKNEDMMKQRVQPK